VGCDVVITVVGTEVDVVGVVVGGGRRCWHGI
jgi:hypothetical protein